MRDSLGAPQLSYTYRFFPRSTIWVGNTYAGTRGLLHRDRFIDVPRPPLEFKISSINKHVLRSIHPGRCAHGPYLEGHVLPVRLTLLLDGYEPVKHLARKICLLEGMQLEFLQF